MRTTKLICLAVVSLALAGRIPAATMTTTNRVLSLDECIHLALQFNLDVQIKRVSPLIDEFTLAGAYGAYDPNFNFTARQNFNSSPGSTDPNSVLFGVSSDNYTDTFGPSFTGTFSTGTRYTLAGSMVRNSGSSFPIGSAYSAAASLSLTQPLLKNFWIDATRQTIEVSKRNLKIDELALRLQIMNTITSVQLAYYDLIFARDNVKVQEASLGLAEELLAQNKIRVNLGALAPLDEKQSESQVAARKADLLSAQRDLASQQNALKSLLTADYLTWQNVNPEPSDVLVALPENFNLQESWTHGMTLRPDLQQQRESVEKQNISIKYSYNQLFPQLDLTTTYGHNGIGRTVPGVLNGIQSGNNQFYSYQLVLTLPLDNTSAKNNYKSSKATKELLLLQLKQTEQRIIVDIDNAVKTAQSNFDKLDATREARKFAELALKAEQTKLENGKSTSFIVLQLQRDLTAAKTAEIRALADYNKSLSSLSLSEGTTLEKAKLKVEVK